MKIRQGFVSNSSSSSFCIYGRIIDKTQAETILDKIKFDYSNYSHLEEALQNIDNRWDAYDRCEIERYTVGIALSSMEDDETLGQLKKEVENKFNELLGDGEPCAIHEDGWYNG
jgi:regulator of sigma D